MRPKGKGLYDSLYFDYPTFPFRRPPELDGQKLGHPVAIVGAGPVGLTAALELARRGIRSVVLDDKDTLNDGSRAICISRNSFETLQQLGVVAPFLDKSLGWTHGQCFYRDKMIYRLEMPHSEDERFKPMYNIQQQYIEQFLVDKAADYPGLIDLRWQSRVTALERKETGVRLTVETPEGDYELAADWLLAADGARSTIRKMCGLSLQGKNLEGNYVIADVQMNHDFPTERRSFFRSSANPDATILIHKQPDNIWRIDYQLQEGESAEEAVREENIRTRVQAILDMVGHTGDWQLEWWSIYTANTLCLDDYRHGRVMFIGDSGHIVPIFGVRGLNNGFADAVNAAWKLAYVLKGAAPEALLDSYTPERRGATLDVFANAGKSARFMTPPTPGYALMREAVLSLAVNNDFTKRFADPRQVQPYTYAESPLTSFPERDAAFDAGPSAGAPAVNQRLGADDYLLDHLGRGFSGFYFSEDGNVPGDIEKLFGELQADGDAFTPVVLGRADHAGIFAAYGAGTGSFYLIRPDRHIAARWKKIVPGEVRDAVHIALGESK
ncbi:FAD-dependent monooxygenase [Emcibacter nanhaiensis]|uniref:Monooxygenase n=1 Tax=Emcibacter nanhaiensis TaxID=1505037 RepID=A0A501PPM1_9PROT|nr:FAD-dependent monooxygenase [Emcibacter nanhaiensis]TPD61721.1 monooxygenase [Emcibacter nanhaiensis]